MRVLVVNAGSSSLKLRVVDDADDVTGSADLDMPPAGGLGAALDDFVASAPPFEVAGHRVVHGGTAHVAPLVIDADADAALDALAELAPLHNPPALAAVRELRRRRPGLVQVACFDTAFHAGMPAMASTYALPSRWRVDWGIRRFGFHGLSHSWASRRAAELLGRPIADTRLVTAHLGSGASLAAVARGRSVDTTMGFTPLEGLAMATRSGSVDPGALLWALRHGDIDADGIEADLEQRSGLLGLSERSGDLRQVLVAADAGDAAALLAYEVYVHRIQTATGAMAVACGGMDALVFTGGAGEGSARLRVDVCAGLGVLGVAPLAGPAVEAGSGDRMLTPSGPAPAVAVVAAREDLEIARLVRERLGGHATPASPEPV
jgi:acetate kinase